MSSKKTKKESFEWIRKNIADIDPDNLLKLVAKTTMPTVHPEDPNYHIRKFTPQELELAARTLIAKPVGLNHQMVLEGSIVVDSEWNEKEQQVECLAYVPNAFIHKKVEDGEIKQCSVEFGWRDEETTNGETTFYGLNFQRIDLLEGLDAGDSNTRVILFESTSKTGKLFGEAKLAEKVVQKDSQWCVVHCSGPDAGKVIKCFDNKADADAMHAAIMIHKGEVVENGQIPQDWWDACISAVSGKADDPEALCNWIYHNKIEAKVVEQTPKTDEERAKAHFKISDEEWEKLTPEQKADYISKLPPRGSALESNKKPEEILQEQNAKLTELTNRIGELETALATATKATEGLKKDVDKKVSDAKTEAKKEVLDKIKKVIPNSFVEGKFPMGAKRFCEEIKKVVFEESKEVS